MFQASHLMALRNRVAAEPLRDKIDEVVETQTVLTRLIADGKEIPYESLEVLTRTTNELMKAIGPALQQTF